MNILCPQQTGTTALFFAAQGGFIDITKILLKSGAIVDCASVDGGTALLVIKLLGAIRLMKLFFPKGSWLARADSPIL